jgi:tetratricopeptide (TPR) repeat protein
MRRFLDGGLLVKVLIPLLLIPILGIAPQPHRITRRFEQAGRAMQLNPTQEPCLEIAGALAQVAGRFPERKGVWECAGIAAMQADDPERAVQYLEKAQALRSLSSPGRVSLGDAYRQVGRMDEAVEVWQSELDNGAVSIPLYERMLALHRDQGVYEKAIEDLRILISLQPARADLNYQLGLLLAAYDPQAALPHLVRASDLLPQEAKDAQVVIDAVRASNRVDDPAYTLVASGRALGSINQWDLAAGAFSRAVDLRPDYAEAWAFLGEAQQHIQGEGEKDGLAALEKALDLNPHSLSANLLMAIYWKRQGIHKLAIEYLDTAIAIDPSNPALYVERGDNRAFLGDFEAGYEDYKKAVDISPRDPTYRRALAAFSIKYDYQLREIGLAAARQAMILSPDDPASLDVMGQTLLRLGDLANAERFLHHALEIDPDYMPAHLHLGLVYIMDGESTQAYLTWTLVRDTAPGSVSSQQAERLLQSYFP